ncbi:hypothetical protein GCM10022222_59210 [Amycolatopsis ultiminotia]|uniref:PAP2 superfamily protein n=2 Tax=Amycolatopsis ultiminotia TaxID=543629 RepID=A0ABP6XM55_9PSEU
MQTELLILEWVHERVPRSAVPFARVVTALGETPVVWALVGTSCLVRAVRSGGRAHWAGPLSTLAAATALRRGTAELIARPRPPERLWRAPWSGPSFPSRHTALGTLGVALAAADLLSRPAGVTCRWQRRSG